MLKPYFAQTRGAGAYVHRRDPGRLFPGLMAVSRLILILIYMEFQLIDWCHL